MKRSVMVALPFVTSTILWPLSATAGGQSMNSAMTPHQELSQLSTFRRTLTQVAVSTEDAENTTKWPSGHIMGFSLSHENS